MKSTGGPESESGCSEAVIPAIRAFVASGPRANRAFAKRASPAEKPNWHIFRRKANKKLIFVHVRPYRGTIHLKYGALKPFGLDRADRDFGLGGESPDHPAMPDRSPEREFAGG